MGLLSTSAARGSGSIRLFLWAPPPARKYFLGKMAAVSVCVPPVGGFSFDNCRRCGCVRGRVQGGSERAVAGSELCHSLAGKYWQRVDDEARGPCDSGELGPERGLVLRPRLSSRLPVALDTVRLGLFRRVAAPSALKVGAKVLKVGGFSEQMGVKANSFPEFL